MNLKPPLSYEDQVSRLIEHHMQVSSKKDAAAFLSKVNYYRLTGYALQFRDETGQDYFERTSFETVRNIYRFDTELRGILRDALDEAEGAFRTHIANGFSMIKCSKSPYDGHYDLENFYRKELYRSVMESLKREEERREDSLVVQHHKRCYGDTLPLWVIVEMLSFSSLSTLYSAMYLSEQDKIATMRGQTAKVMKNHMHVLTVLRNKCSHGRRLYNTPLHPSVMLGSGYLRNHPKVGCDTLFAGILALMRNLPERESKILLYNRLCTCLTKYAASIDLSCIGFPANYKQLLQIELSNPGW